MKGLKFLFALFAILALVVRADDAIDEKDVVVLSDANFTTSLGEAKFALVRRSICSRVTYICASDHRRGDSIRRRDATFSAGSPRRILERSERMPDVWSMNSVFVRRIVAYMIECGDGTGGGN